MGDWDVIDMQTRAVLGQVQGASYREAANKAIDLYAPKGLRVIVSYRKESGEAEMTKPEPTHQDSVDYYSTRALAKYLVSYVANSKSSAGDVEDYVALVLTRWRDAAEAKTMTKRIMMLKQLRALLEKIDAALSEQTKDG